MKCPDQPTRNADIVLAILQKHGAMTRKQILDKLRDQGVYNHVTTQIGCNYVSKNLKTLADERLVSHGPSQPDGTVTWQPITGPDAAYTPPIVGVSAPDYVLETPEPAPDDSAKSCSSAISSPRFEATLPADITDAALHLLDMIAEHIELHPLKPTQPEPIKNKTQILEAMARAMAMVEFINPDLADLIGQGYTVLDKLDAAP